MRPRALHLRCLSGPSLGTPQSCDPVLLTPGISSFDLEFFHVHQSSKKLVGCPPNSFPETRLRNFKWTEGDDNQSSACHTMGSRDASVMRVLSVPSAGGHGRHRIAECMVHGLAAAGIPSQNNCSVIQTRLMLGHPTRAYLST
jgi:hypothetical protein